MGTTLRYPYEIPDSKEYFDDIPNVKVAPDMRKLAEHILQSKPMGTWEVFIKKHHEGYISWAEYERIRRCSPAALTDRVIKDTVRSREKFQAARTFIFAFSDAMS
jgi:hypothetical protein